MAKKLISIDDAASAGTRLPSAVRTEIAALPVSTATSSALGGKADLSGGKLAVAQLPDLAIADFLGTVANQTAMLALVGQKGDWCARSDTSTVWVISGNTPTNISSWTQMLYPSAGTVADGSVTTAKLANDSVTGDKLSPYVEDAVTKALSAVQPNTAPRSQASVSTSAHQRKARCGRRPTRSATASGRRAPTSSWRTHRSPPTTPWGRPSPRCRACRSRSPPPTGPP